jgi:cell wall assembly regulator SMI1
MHPLIESLKLEFSSELEQKLLAPPASEEEIEHFKQKVKQWELPPLPEVFYDFFRWHNGSQTANYSLVEFFDGESILPLSNIISDKEMWDNHENNDVFKEYEQGTWWNKAWVPFLYIPDWWVGVIDTKGCFGGKAGQILGFDFKSAEGKSIRHKSFEKWLETMLALKKAGLLHVAQDEETGYLTTEQENSKSDIFDKINGSFPFHVDIWQYRRKASPENPHWQTLEQYLRNQDFENAKLLIESRKIDLNEQNLYIMERLTPLLLALDLKTFSFAEWLILQGADLNTKDCYGYDAFSKIKSAYVSKQITNIEFYIELLLKKGYEPKEFYGVHWLAPIAENAVNLNDFNTLDYCLSKGLDINKIFPDYYFKTLLHNLVENNGSWQTAKILIEKGLDKSLKNKAGKTALELYQERCQDLKQIFKHSYTPNDYDSWINTLS